MSDRYLILGSLGMLGRAWRELLAARGIAFDHGDRDEIDITSAESIERALQAPSQRAGHGVGSSAAPSQREGVGGGFSSSSSSSSSSFYTHVINCAAWTDVDAAETNEAGATLLNGTAVGLLADACARHGAMLVHYSTDYVFNGTATTPYRTDQPRDPLNAYGRSKAAGEIELERWPLPSLVGQASRLPSTHSTSSRRWLCLRTSWLYAPWGKNFVRTIASAALTRPELKVVNDQRGRPTSAEHLARVSLAMIEAGASGMYHATDGGECTWFDFACHIVECLRHAPSQRGGSGAGSIPAPSQRGRVGGGFSSSSSSCPLPAGGVGGGPALSSSCPLPVGGAGGGPSSASSSLARVVPCTSAEFPRPAKRPAYSVLDIAKTEHLVGTLTDWRTNLEDVMKRREG